MNQTKQLPDTPAIQGTKVHCSVLSVPLSNYFDEDAIDTLATIFAQLSPALNWRIPDERAVVAGFTQNLNGICDPPTNMLLGINPSINATSVLFNGGHLVTERDLKLTFKYLTCELGYIGLDLVSGQQAPDGVRAGASTLFNDVLGPDIIRLDKLVQWAITESQRIAFEISHVDKMLTAPPIFRPILKHHAGTVAACRESGVYLNLEHGSQPSGPVTPEDFVKLREGTFFHERPTTRLEPVTPELISDSKPPDGLFGQDPTEDSVEQELPDPPEMPPVVAEILCFEDVVSFEDHTRGLSSKKRFVEQLMIPGRRGVNFRRIAH